MTDPKLTAAPLVGGTILVPFPGVEADAQILQVAAALGRRFGARVEAFHATVDPREAVAFVGEGMTAGMIEQVMNAADQDGQARSGRARALFERAVGAATGIAFVEKPGHEDELIAERGRLADMIVAAKPDPDTAISSTLEACLRETRRPVLVVPPNIVTADFGQRIAIAWNGSIESARAVTAALPFLRGASYITVLSISEPVGPVPAGADVVDYLAAHGVKAVAEQVALERNDVGAALLTRVGASSSDMLVMGAYTRSHMRRLIFGGVTGEVLAHTGVPVLMVH